MRALIGTRLEIALSGGLLLWAAGEAIFIPSDWSTGTRLAYALAATAPLALRHRFPFAVAGWAFGAFVLDGVIVVLPLFAVTPMQGVAVGIFAIAAYGRPRRRAFATIAAAMVVLTLLFWFTERSAPVTSHDAIVFVVMQLLALSAGMAVRLRDEEVQRATAQMTSAGAAHARRLHDGLAAERRRIARELHAIVTRDLTAIARLARAARAQVGVADRRAAHSLSAIAGTTTGALDELRRLLHVLHADDDPGERRTDVPSAGRADCAVVVAAARERGWRVELVERGLPAGSRSAAEVAAARIVAELLAGEGAGTPGHAGARMRGGARAGARRDGGIDVTVTRADGGVRLALSGRGRAAAALREPTRLAAARERARLHGGMLLRRRAPRGWRIEAELPARGAAAGRLRSSLPGASAVVVAAPAFAALAIEQLLNDGRAIGWISGLAFVVLPLLLLRSRAALLTACLLAGGGLLGRALVGWMPDTGLSLVAVIVFAPYAVAAHASTRQRGIAGGAIVVLCACAALASWPNAIATDFPLTVCVIAISWTAGWYVRGSSRAARGLRLDAARLAEVAPERLRAALDAERHRVARDLHDVVAHGVSLIGILAGAARATLPHDRARTRVVLGDLEDAIAGTHVELERLLDALRAGDDSTAAVVTLDDLDAIVADARRAGQPVALDVARAAVAAAPAGVRSSACRIVQEALTNARKHACGSDVAVRVIATGGTLVVQVSNDGPPGGERAARGLGARRGIEGMRERARLLGGELDAGPTPAGGFRVRARLPLGLEAADAA